MAERTKCDWVSRYADQVVAEAEKRAPGKPIVCASGLSPSGPIHLGNLRKVMTPHLVADEIRRRGYECVHLLSWDDYDRFRRVPAGIDPSWVEHIGKPLTSVPAPPGSAFLNWAERFKAPVLTALAELGVEVHGVSQTAQYTSGAYRREILLAMRERARVDAILARYRTKVVPAPIGTDTEDEGVRRDEYRVPAHAAVQGDGPGGRAGLRPAPAVAVLPPLRRMVPVVRPKTIRPASRG